jgi:hypothetical protein
MVCSISVPHGPLYPGKLSETPKPSGIVGPGKWTFGEMAAKIIADAYAAAAVSVATASVAPADPSVNFIEFGPIHPMQLSQKEKQALAYVQAHAMAAQAKYEAALAKMTVEMTAKTLAIIAVECTCAAKVGVIGHAAFCHLKTAKVL